MLQKCACGENKVGVNPKNISDFLGIKKFKFGELESKDKVGIVIGLAWTELVAKY